MLALPCALRQVLALATAREEGGIQGQRYETRVLHEAGGGWRGFLRLRDE